MNICRNDDIKIHTLVRPFASSASKSLGIVVEIGYTDAKPGVEYYRVHWLVTAAGNVTSGFVAYYDATEITVADEAQSCYNRTWLDCHNQYMPKDECHSYAIERAMVCWRQKHHTDAAVTVRPGQHVTATFTVKEHKVWNDFPETAITRVEYSIIADLQNAAPVVA